VENCCEYCNEPSGSIKIWKFLGGFSRRAHLHEISSYSTGIYASTLQTKRLILFTEIMAAYFENNTENRNIVWRNCSGFERQHMLYVHLALSQA
jgi:hypothetical protein